MTDSFPLGSDMSPKVNFRPPQTTNVNRGCHFATASSIRSHYSGRPKRPQHRNDQHSIKQNQHQHIGEHPICPYSKREGKTLVTRKTQRSCRHQKEAKTAIECHTDATSSNIAQSF